MAWRAETPCGAFGLGHCGWNGKLAAVTNANGFVTAYAYDVMDRVTNIAWRTTAGASLGGFAYEYDAVGRIVSRRHSLGDPSNLSQSSQKAYAYDDLDRLVSDGGVAYAYDAAGNRMTKTENGETVVYTLGDGDRLVSYGRARSPSAPQLVDVCGVYSYDAAGNVTQIVRNGGPTLDLVWNGQYQLVSVSTNGVFAEGYAYDALGRRAATTTREGTTRHVYDDGWQVVADIDGEGNVLASYVWGEGIDRLLAVKIGGESYYPLTDIQGTVWGYVNSQNNIVARWQYDAWGNVVEESVSVPALATLRYRFQGREWSAATGLTNFRMRWYDSVTGRWLSKDPIGLSGGLNLYVFCGNSPNLHVDPRGELWPQLAIGLGVVYFVYTQVRNFINRKKKMESADINDPSDLIEKAIDVTVDMLTDITPVTGPPSPTDTTAPVVDAVKDIAIKPIWNKPFDNVRPSRQNRRKCVDYEGGQIRRLGE